MSTDYKSKYHNMFNQEKKALMDTYKESTKPRSFRSLFSGPRSSRASLLISEMRIIPDMVDDKRATDGLASSNVIV